MAKEPTLSIPTWGCGASSSSAVREGEAVLEGRVSAFISKMSFLVLDVADEPGPRSQRGYVERNAISLLSNFGKEPLDPPSPHWFGHHCPRDKVRRSGLWNNNHVDEQYDPEFIEVFLGMCSHR
jgi:hypothetical protein